MVNRGASQGCINCKQRHVKCDESKPQCKRCLRLGSECAGYGKKSLNIRFKNETGRLYGKRSGQGTRNGSSSSLAKPKAAATTMKAMTTTKSAQSSLPASCSHTVILPSPQLAQQDLALSFFLTYVTGVGRNLESTRGFMEFVRPVLATEHHNSALFTAVNAAASLLWLLLGHSNVPASQPIHLLDQGLRRLQEAIKDPEERGRDATVLAALVLQAYETISAVFGQHRADGTHRDGALALLLHRGGAHAEATKYHGSLLGNILHAKVSLCVREKRSFPLRGFESIQTKVFPQVPVNPSFLLDTIGISVANLQHKVLLSSPCQEQLSYFDLEGCSQCASVLDTRLRIWQNNVPHYWHPKRITTGLYATASDFVYQGVCDVYPTLQIANIWSVWRIYRLILIQIKLKLAENMLKHTLNHKHALQKDTCMGNVTDSATHMHENQKLLDSLCYSVPFYLGNRRVPAIYSDMENSELLLPSCHDLQPTDDAYISYLGSDCYVSKQDHRRHVLVHGALHIMSILAHHVGMFVEARSLSVSECLERKQKKWILHQFLRSAYLLRLVPEGVSLDLGDYCRSVEIAFDDVEDSKVAAIASIIRKRLWTISVL